MSPSGKTVVFMICATLFNILMLGVLVVAFLVLITLALGPKADPTVYQILLFVAFIAAIVITFIAYGWIMKKVTARYKLEEKMPQLFRGKKK